MQLNIRTFFKGNDTLNITDVTRKMDNDALLKVDLFGGFVCYMYQTKVQNLY